jgi:transcription initiation factor TFIIB
LYQTEVIAKKVNLPQYIIEEAKEIFTRLHKQGILKGKNHKAIISSIIYFVSANSENINVSFRTLAEITGVSESKIRKTYRYLLMNGYLQSKRSSFAKPSKYISQIIFSQEFSQQKSRINLSLLAQFADELGSLLHGKKPRGIAAASVYIFSTMLDTKFPQSKISKQAGVSSLTLRRIIKEVSQKFCVIVEV